jgi:hypothetical protein
MSLRSRLGLGDVASSPPPPPDATHVLYFAPPACGGDAAWYLVSVEDWCGLMPRDWTFLGEFQPDYDLADQPCESFTAETLGFPVTLAEFGYRGVSRWKTEQAFWVTPAA